VRYAVLSDVHGNLEALSAVMADAASEGALGILCLGDSVGYGADPAPCVDLLGERAVLMVAGNHEHGALGLLDVGWFNAAAREAALWTRDHLGADHQTFLTGLPLASTLGEATCVHASPRRPEEWDYLLSAEDGFQAFGDFATRLCFVGHSHRPGAWSLGSSGPAYEDLAGPAFHDHRIPFHDGRRYIINVGSVGQPRDRDPRAAYVLWDEDERSVTLRRVTYDHKAAATKILRAGLPRALADRLAHGV
jgi:diadenosine tetraphosphatase ApaH/serine/threonine PP2A family protein phosphatase